MKKIFTFLFALMAAFQLNSANYLVADFEDGQLGSTKAIWSAGSCSVVDNPYKSGINTSNKALAVVNNAWVPVTIPCTLPEGKTWYDYKSVKVKFCLTAGTDFNWAQVQIGLCTGDWGMEQVGVLSEFGRKLVRRQNQWQGDHSIRTFLESTFPIAYTPHGSDVDPWHCALKFAL